MLMEMLMGGKTDIGIENLVVYRLHQTMFACQRDMSSILQQQ